MKNIILLNLILITITLAACSNATAATPEVDIAPVETISSSVVCEGKLLPYPSVELAFVQHGTIADVLVQPGDTIDSDDVVARLVGSETIQAELESAQFELANARNMLDNLYKDTDLYAAQALQAKEDYKKELEELLNFNLQKAEVLKAIADAQKAIDTHERNYRYQQTSANQYDIDAAQAQVILAEDALEDAIEDFKKHEHKNEENLQRAYYLSKKAAAEKAYEATVRKLNSLQGTGRQVDIDFEEGKLIMAQAQLAQAKREWERIQDGPDAGDIAVLEALIAHAQKDYEIYSKGPDPNDVALGVARLENAQAHIKAAEEALLNLELRAPFNGTMFSLGELAVGQAVNSGIPVAYLGDPTRWQVETTDLAEIDIANVGIGKLATIKLDAFPGEKFSAKVVEIDTVGREHLGDMTYKVTLELDQPDPRFMWNMTATVMIELD